MDRPAIRIRTLAALAATIWVVLSTAPCAAAEFRTSALSMSVNALNFPTSTIDPGSSELKFTDTLMRTETATSIEVTLPADVLFDFDKADIRADAQAPLRELAQLLRDKARRSISVVGHTDALGNDAYNQKLSQRRAEAVKAWLTKREGIVNPPIATSGRGSREPVARNKHPDGSDDPDGRQLNRRVTVVFQK